MPADVDEAETSRVPVAVPGVRNFRDAGGVGALRRGVLYRSGALHELLPGGAQSLEQLGVRTVVDLRSVPEMADRPDVCDGYGLTHVRAPVFAERSWPDDQLELYPFMAEHAGRSVVAVIRRLLTPGPPVLVHCASGKDRTGVVVAVLQTLWGASEAEVVSDFLRSNAELGLSGGPAPSATGHGALPVTATHIRRAMLWIRSIHGSVSAYLVEHGATEAELTALRMRVT
ncbi:tyrosine-protein phosphatase [Micromonospora sp. NPDC048170]|uniref:tyrosine-protein phosphatase n=1 Tax=Micromonospora sp. NPDC048170 TaxID=3154819 RepID=UPI0034063576